MRAIAFVIFGLLGCSNDVKPAEDLALSAYEDDAKADSFRRPTDHGEITLGSVTRADLSATQGYHSWSFVLQARSEIKLTTVVTTRGQFPDTVLYLYSQRANGTYGRYIARNDDYDDSYLSQISGEFDAGTYRVVVKGYTRDVAGPFGMLVECPSCTERRQTPEYRGLYFTPDRTAPAGVIRWLMLNTDKSYEAYFGTDGYRSVGTYELNANGEEASLELVSSHGTHRVYDVDFDGHDLRLRREYDGSDITLVAIGHEDMCHETNGHYLDDDANSAGDYCVCDEPLEWLPGYGGCVAR